MVTLSDLVVLIPIFIGLASIPLLSLELKDYTPTGKLILNLSETEVKQIPSKFSKSLTSDKFEKTYETAFGKINFVLSPGMITQELVRPDRTVMVTQTPDGTTWKMIGQKYTLKITQTHDKTVEECTTPDGSYTKTKELGGITEIFKGLNPDTILQICSEAEAALQEEVNRMEEVKEQSTLPISGLNIAITKINVSTEWVEIQNFGGSDVDMERWTLEDFGGSNKYTFQNFTLNAGNSIKIYSNGTTNEYNTKCQNGEASSNPSEGFLCWSKKSVWGNTNDIATLKDSKGSVISSCRYESGDVNNGLVICNR